MENNVNEVVEETGEVIAETVTANPTNWKLMAFVVGATVLTGGLATAGYFGYKAWKKRKAAKANAQPVVIEPTEEAQKAN